MFFKNNHMKSYLEKLNINYCVSSSQSPWVNTVKTSSISIKDSVKGTDDALVFYLYFSFIR